MNLKALVIHCGFHKTGTSSLQRYCYDHSRELLSRYRILYPRSIAENYYGSHNPLAISLLQDQELLYYKVRQCRYDTLLENLLMEVKNKDFVYLLISSEFFDFPELFSPFRLCKDLIHLIDINKIIFVFYLRRQDLFFESDYKQHLRDATYRPTCFIDDALKSSIVRRRMDYYRTLMKLREGIANIDISSSIKVFVYNPKVNIIDHFFKHIFDIRLGINNNEYLLNQSLSAESALALRMINEEFEIPGELHWKLSVEYLVSIDKIHGSKLRWLLPLKDRIAILEEFQRSNELLFDIFFQQDNKFLMNANELKDFYKHEEFAEKNKEEIEYRVRVKYEKAKEFLLNNLGTHTLQPRRCVISGYKWIRGDGWKGFYGYIERADSVGIEGWAFCMGRGHVNLELYIDDFKVYEWHPTNKREDISERYGIYWTAEVGFLIDYRKIEFSTEFLYYIFSLARDKVLKISVVEKSSGKGICGNYKKVTAGELQGVLILTLIRVVYFIKTSLGYLISLDIKSKDVEVISFIQGAQILLLFGAKRSKLIIDLSPESEKSRNYFLLRIWSRAVHVVIDTQRDEIIILENGAEENQISK